MTTEPSKFSPVTTAQVIFSVALGCIAAFITFFAVYVASRTMRPGRNPYKPRPKNNEVNE